MKVYIITFGCKVNQYESEAILEMLIKNGYTKSDNLAESDIVILNSCTVTAESDRKLRQTIHKVKKLNPLCITVLIGCMPQAFPDKAEGFEDIDIIIGNSNKSELISYINNFIKSRKKIVNIVDYNSFDFSSLPIATFSDRTRAFLKIEDGCNKFCSYCIIPYSRGRVRSKPIKEIYEESATLAKNGYKEISLVGINLCAFGEDINSSLSEAIDIISKVSGIERIRLGSLEPDLLTDEFLIKLSKNKKFCPHFHLSIQSGSNKILKAMRRCYTREFYLEIVRKIRNIFCDATITTDMMVGFPGESDEDFDESLDIIRKVNFLKVHVFPYSVRPGTLAGNMKNQIPNDIKSLRVRIAINEANRQTKNILGEYIGKTVNVLYESAKGNVFYEGYTSNYILVRARSLFDVKGKILPTFINESFNDYCQGNIL